MECHKTIINTSVLLFLSTTECDCGRFRTGTKTGTELGVKLGVVFFKMAHRSGRDSQLLGYFSPRRFQANRRAVGFSQLKTKRLGLVDDFRTFRVERPATEFFDFLAA